MSESANRETGGSLGNKKRPVLFLDIDGVLHPYKYASRYCCVRGYGSKACARTSRNVRRILASVPDIRVILSSFHRRHYVEETEKLWRKCRISVEGHTPEFERYVEKEGDAECGAGVSVKREIPNGSPVWRGTEIAWWLERHADEVATFCILDDLDLTPHLATFAPDTLVRPVDTKGVSECDADRAIATLCGRPWTRTSSLLKWLAPIRKQIEAGGWIAKETQVGNVRSNSVSEFSEQ